ncbi:MAG: carbohydrate binding domain-containing protein [Paludibacteraceae bacterium]|nr:carbohydrate binding domain-containing protein [Paludibacteraceae bacterium]
MKRTTLLVSLFLMMGMYMNSQELIVNGGFENWVNSDSVANWDFSTATGQSFSKETSIVHSGTASLLSTHTATSGTAKVLTKPYVNPVTPGTTYTFSFWYYADATGTTNLTNGFRMWGYWQNPDGSNGSFDQKNLQPNAYIDLTGNTGVWKQFSVDVVPPTGAGQVQLEVRFYRQTKIYIDDVSFTAKTSGINDVKFQNLNVWISNNKITFEALKGEKVEIFNAVGQSLYRALATDGINSVSIKNQGVSIVKVGNRIGKVVL